MRKASVSSALFLWIHVLFAQPDYRFSNGGKPQVYQLAQNELHVQRSGASSIRSAKSESWGDEGVILTLQGSDALQKLRQDHAVRGSVAPVFYDSSELPSMGRLAAMPEELRIRRMAGARRVMTAKLMVKMDDARYGALAPTKPVGKGPSRLPGWMLISYADPMAALDAVDWMIRLGWEVIPMFSRQVYKRQALLQRDVNDTLYVNQWHLGGFGFHLNLQDAWDSVTGKGINIAVVDDGLDIRHEDLAPNAYPVESGYHRNFNSGPPDDPSPLKASESHGTSCAGLAAAAGFNDLGVIGVAPEARLIGLRLIAGPITDEDAGDALGWRPNGLTPHVSSNSWGPADDGKALGRIGPLQAAGLETAATTYRNGLGEVFAISCGNGRAAGDDSGYDGFSSSRFGIAVAAVNRDGEQASYSENGMNVAVSAFGGEFDPPGVLWTTTNSGVAAMALRMAKFPGSIAPVNYTDAFSGTSAAAPQVAGAAALLLERNPNLGYRDIKEILIRSATRDSLKGGDAFVANGAGLRFSHSFGAGLVNVADALALASNWAPLGPVLTGERRTAEVTPLPDGGLPVVRNLDFYGGQPLRVEHVELTVTVQHANRGDLSFVITSPSGMRSIAAPRPNDDGSDFDGFTFTSVRHWGENSAGIWRVAIADSNPNGLTGEVRNVAMRLYGTAAR